MSPVALEHPPLAPLERLLERLRAHGLTHALGGSGLLAALGLVSQVRDWDVTVVASIETLEAASAGLDYRRFGSDGCHADHKLTFEREAVELISNFAFSVPGGVVTIPTVVTGHWRGIPLGSPTAWAVAYALMGELEDSGRRRERAAMLFEWLRGQPCERKVIEALLAQPLLEGIAVRLRTLA